MEENQSLFVPTEWERLPSCHGLLFKLSRVCIIDRLLRKQVILHMKTIFANHRILVTVVSDNGPQFRGLIFKEFARQYGFKHVTSSPYYPQSNGLAEKTVHVVKRLLKKAAEAGEDPHLATFGKWEVFSRTSDG